MCDYKAILKEAIEKNPDVFINEWIKYFPEEEKDEEYRHYDDFLGFFEECLETDLDPNSDEAKALKMFLEKLVEVKGLDKFFNFRNSVYTCYLKFPILKYLDSQGCFNFKIVSKITSFFESLTSSIIVSVLKKSEEIQRTALEELEEREAPMAEVWEGVIMLSIVGTLDSNRVLKIIDKVLDKLNEKETDYVVIDISSIYDMNSEVARQLIKLHNAIHFMGTEALLTGITPEIAKSLTHLDIKLGDIKTFSSTKRAMEFIINERRKSV